MKSNLQLDRCHALFCLRSSSSAYLILRQIACPNKRIQIDLCRNDRGDFFKLSTNSTRERKEVTFPVSGALAIAKEFDEFAEFDEEFGDSVASPWRKNASPSLDAAGNPEVGYISCFILRWFHFCAATENEVDGCDGRERALRLRPSRRFASRALLGVSAIELFSSYLSQSASRTIFICIYNCFYIPCQAHYRTAPPEPFTPYRLLTCSNYRPAPAQVPCTSKSGTGYTFVCVILRRLYVFLSQRRHRRNVPREEGEVGQ